jgi:hypothetical protein
MQGCKIKMELWLFGPNSFAILMLQGFGDADASRRDQQGSPAASLASADGVATRQVGS